MIKKYEIKIKKSSIILYVWLLIGTWYKIWQPLFFLKFINSKKPLNFIYFHFTFTQNKTFHGPKSICIFQVEIKFSINSLNLIIVLHPILGILAIRVGHSRNNLRCPSISPWASAYFKNTIIVNHYITHSSPL